MTAAIYLPGHLQSTVPVRGEKAGDTAKAASAFDTILSAPPARDNGKGPRTHGEEGGRPAWSWGRLQHGPEDGGASPFARDPATDGASGKNPLSKLQDADGVREERATPLELQPLMENGEQGTADSSKDTQPPDTNRIADIDAGGDEVGHLAIADTSLSSQDAVGRIAASDTSPTTQKATSAPLQGMPANEDPTTDELRVARLSSGTQEAHPQETTTPNNSAKAGADIMLERAPVDRTPPLVTVEPRNDLRTRADAMRNAVGMKSSVHKPGPAEASSQFMASDPDGKAVTEKRQAVSSTLAAQLRQDGRNKDPIAQRVTVLSSQSTPVAPPSPLPAQFSSSLPSTQVVAAIREESQQVARAAAAAMEAQDFSTSRSRPLHSIQIQLQPNDLGRVTARMTMEGNHLQVELRVETSQARAQLTSDTDSILKALKASGFEIDRVTIQQVQPGSNTITTNGQDRGGNQLASHDGDSDEAGQQRNRNAFDNTEDSRQDGNDGSHQKAARGGLYI